MDFGRETVVVAPDGRMSKAVLSGRPDDGQKITRVLLL